MNRQDKIFIRPSEYTISGGITLRPFSVGTLLLLDRMGVNIADLSEESTKPGERLQIILTLGWLQSTPVSEILSVISDPEKTEIKLVEFSTGLPLDSITKLASTIGEMLKDVQAVMFSTSEAMGAGRGN